MSRADCSCTRTDYECDFGFQLNPKKECERVPDMPLSGFGVPEECDGSFTVTRGYRKVPGDSVSARKCRFGSLFYAKDTYRIHTRLHCFGLIVSSGNVCCKKHQSSFFPPLTHFFCEISTCTRLNTLLVYACACPHTLTCVWELPTHNYI